MLTSDLAGSHGNHSDCFHGDLPDLHNYAAADLEEIHAVCFDNWTGHVVWGNSLAESFVGFDYSLDYFEHYYHMMRLNGNKHYDLEERWGNKQIGSRHGHKVSGLVFHQKKQDLVLTLHGSLGLLNDYC